MFVTYIEKGEAFLLFLGEDITERKKAEDALRDSNRKYSAIVENANDAIYLIDPETQKILEINDTACKMTGYSKEELKRMYVYELHPEDERALLPEKFGKVSEKGSVQGISGVNHLTKDGKLVPIEVNATMIELDGKELNVSIVRDITDRKKAEKDREILINAMGERVKELQCVYGLAESIRKRKTVKEIFIDLLALIPLGWHYPDIARGKIRFDGQEYVIEPFDETEWKQTSDILINGKHRGSVEVYYLEERPELDEGPFLSEERDLIDGIAHTLCEAIELKKAEEELHLFAEIMKNVNEGIYVVGMDDVIIKYTNPGFEKMFGYNQGEMIGKEALIVNAPTEKTPEETKNQIMEVLINIGEWHGEVKNIKKDGTTFWSYANVTLFNYSKFGKVLVSVHTDISDRKKAEGELQEAHVLLEKRVKERTLELFESNAALKVLLNQREQDKGEFESNILSNVKHLVMPYISKLKKNRLESDELSYLNLIESNLKEIISPFSQKLASDYIEFTPREIQVANFIKDGAQDKDIMETLNISLDTVKTHRKKIRRKLGIYGKRINLRTKLLSMT